MELLSFAIYASIYVGLIAITFYALSFFAGRKRRKLLFKDHELPKVSIMIPAYNEEESIARTLESILTSDYPKKKFEVIVVNDGSTDKTLEIAKKFRKRGVRVFSKENGGKGTALNLALKKCKGEIVFSMDADTFVETWSVKEMVRYFKGKDVMCVTPGIVVYKPKGIWQRVQYMEYALGLFLRKSFASLNAMHITPGAFSAYKKSFFDKYGGYDEDNLTEDLEVSLRVQYHNYVIENSPESPAYTIAPRKFYNLLKQRRRWYAGLMKNTWKYKKIFGPKYGDLGMFVFPIAWVSIFLSVLVTSFLFFDALSKVKQEMLLLNSINFDFATLYNVNLYFIERVFFKLVTNPVFIFIMFFMVVFGFYLYYASKKVEKISGLSINLPLFFIFFSFLFGFWWIVSIIYVTFNRKVKWR